MARRPPPGAPVLTRRYGVLDQLPRLYVVCEGGTEKRCLDELRAHWRIPSIQVEVVSQGGDPTAVVRKAKERRTASGGRRKKPAVEIWVAFDRDEHEKWPGAIQQALDLGFELAVSNPCIELWGLLLHSDQNAWPGYPVASATMVAREVHGPVMTRRTMKPKILSPYRRLLNR